MNHFYENHWILTFLIVFPLLGALAAYLAGERNAKWVALLAGLIEFAVSIPLFFTFQPNGSCRMSAADARTGMGVWLERDVPFSNCADYTWFAEWGIHYRIGMDGISLFMVLLTTLLLPLMVLGSWTYIRDRERGFYASLLALTGGVVGVFVSLDLFRFYMFW